MRNLYTVKQLADALAALPDQDALVTVQADGWYQYVREVRAPDINPLDESTWEGDYMTAVLFLGDAFDSRSSIHDIEAIMERVKDESPN